MAMMARDNDLTLLSLAVSPHVKLSFADCTKAIIEGATRVALASESPVKTIAGDLARGAFLRFQLLPDEFIDIFHLPHQDVQQKNPPDGGKIFDSEDRNVDRLAEILVGQFINSLYHKKMVAVRDHQKDYSDDSASDNATAFRRDLVEFIDRYHETKHTLHDFLEMKCQIYPLVDPHILFDDEMIRSRFVKQVSRASFSEIISAYADMYRENPEHFVLQYLLKRVISPLSTPTIQQHALKRVKKNIERLLDYLVGQGYQLEKLYMLIFKQFADWRRIHTINHSVREQVTKHHPDLLATANGEHGAGMLDPNFDFDSFFHEYFRPAIIQARSKELPKSPRPIDLQTHGWNLLLAPPSAMDPFKEMAQLALASDPTVFSRKLRTYFGYPLDTTKLPDEALYKIIARQLEIAAGQQIQSTIEQGLKHFSKDDPIREDYAFLEPIISCRDPRKLMIWFAYPHKFIEEFPDFSSVRYEIISCQARRMFEHLILYRGSTFTSDFKNRGKKRDRIQEHLAATLSITDAEPFTHSYRILTQIDPITKEPLQCIPQNGNTANGDNGSSDTYLYKTISADSPYWNKVRHSTGGVIEIDEKTYMAFPIEKKKFISAKISVPQPHGAPRDMEVLFYTDEKNILTCKSLRSYLLSLIRGKLPSDMVRCMVVFPDDAKQEDKDALINLLYDYAAHIIKLEHHVEQRRIGKPLHVSRSTGSSHFADDRLASFSGYAILLGNLPGNIVEKLTPEELDAELHGRYGFEIQVMDLKSVCVAASDFTVSSHHTAYAPERAFEVLSTTYFPPIVYGARYAEHALNGFRGGIKGKKS